ERAGASVIYLRDLRRAAGLLGYPGLGDDFFSSADGLRSRIEQHKPRRVLVAGTSAGCTPALRYGRILGVDAVLALSPVLNLPAQERLPTAFIPIYEGVVTQASLVARNISDVYKGISPAPATTLIHSSEHVQDAAHVAELQDF